MSKITNITKETITEIIGEGKVLLDFYADWCGPCKMMMPALEQLASESDIKVCKVNVDREPELAGEFGVQSIPSFFALNDGEVINKKQGATTKEQLLTMFN